MPTLNMEYSPSVATQLLEAIMAKYVDRGDPVAVDFTLVDIILDGTWRDLDLSGIVAPAAANHLVHIGVGAKATKANNCIRFRKNGNVNDANIVAQFTQTANVSDNEDFLVMMDTDRKIEYNGDTDDWGALTIVVRGWIET